MDELDATRPAPPAFELDEVDELYTAPRFFIDELDRAARRAVQSAVIRRKLLSAAEPGLEAAMRRMTIVAAAALLAPGAAGAEIPSKQQIFCAELRRVVEVAELGGDFTYLERSRAAPPRLGFRHGCRATGDVNKQYWLCGQSLAPEAMSRDNLAARVAACLPEAARTDQRPWRQTLFTLGRAEIRISETGGAEAQGGRIVQLVVEAVPAP